MATILIVDDISANRKLLVTLLGHHGHRVLEAGDGAEALAAVGTVHPDLVITDVLMPSMDGYEFVRRLRLDPTDGSIPVVFHTAHYSMRDATALALSSGPSYVLSKPSDSEQVLRVVGRALTGALDRSGVADDPPLTPEFDREHLRLVTDQLSEKAGDLRTANARLRALINIGLELASERDPDRLLQTVCEAARDLFGATYVTLGILAATDRASQRLVTCGVDPTAWMKTGASVAGLLDTVVAERRTMRGNHPGGDPEIQSFLAAPIASPAHVYGWMCFVSNEGSSFTEDDEQLVRALSGQVGRIFENGRFAELVQKRANELEREVVERKQAESALRQERDRAQRYFDTLRTAEERMRFALEAAGVGIWDMDYTTGVLQCSEIIERHYGMQPRNCSGTLAALVERVHPQDRAAFLATMEKAKATGSDFALQHRSIRPDGSVRWLHGAGRVHLDQQGAPVRAVGIAMDVTERHALEAQYQQAQKMEAIGRLAGGVAHDFNNLLTAILGYCELLLADIDPDDARRADIAEIHKAGESAARLTRQLLAFSRQEVVKPTLLDVNVVVGSLRDLLERLIGEDVNVVLRLCPDIAPVTGDRGQVEQIVLNLAVNARDAMPRGGTLTIETCNIEVGEDRQTTLLALTPGPYVVLVLTDTGTGMTPQVQARLFEPFFTTKEIGKGTGLGLATVHGIVAQSGGTVDIDSEVGRGTSIKVYIPRAAVAEMTVDVPDSSSPPLSGTQTVLVVEDSEELRGLAKRLLERQGYTVLVAGNASEAVGVFMGTPSIDVLLTDVVMPGTSGVELTKRLVEHRPLLKVVYMSGYTSEAIVQHGVLKPGIVFLQKPFTADTLGQKIRDALDQAAPVTARR